MKRNRYFTIHPLEANSGNVFQYGDMQVRRIPLDRHSGHGRKLISIFESYKRAGILPSGSSLIGDYLEHMLLKSDVDEKAGRYLGIVLPDGNYQYLRLEGESIGVMKERLEPHDDIGILTDTCLFSASCAIAVLDNGKEISLVAPTTEICSHIRELRVSQRFCFYELDSILRLTDIINAMKSGNGNFRKIILAMPTVEYYFYLMNAYNDGFIANDLMWEWVVQVDRQAQRLSDAIIERVGMETEICQPLGVAEDYVKARIRTGETVDFERVKSMLSEASTLWREVLPITKPKTWKDLNYTNYTIAALETASFPKESNHLITYIENPSEQRILRGAAKIARKLQRKVDGQEFRIIGIYPHEKVLVSRDTASGSFTRLYYLDENYLLGEDFAREIVRANSRKVT